MLYRLLADATAVTHFAFVAYVVVGGFLAWRFGRTIWLHLLAVCWGFSTIVFGFDCPLTHLENWARERAGEQRLPSSGFIDHYLTGVIYPESALGLVRATVAALVVASWLGYVSALRRRAAPAGAHAPR
ncbi:DUF2784 domain-containing protein [Nocardia implantans]|uniref:DUF2784 domain-containing protein n=1 Tax=Nocardia implantans TaxID=3108168 RepID=A0ABU6ARA8_9NOCA|nr:MULTISPECIES: DUF2784 domain-containing protein [unclassified Nocardia]MBF6191461.1 DUF2784 domain-containing protein [Nocardia beijingensis]MEA3528232.1 DUF2784 domain-containing protein [Nocardia sp. CDC192]MEB3510018.1 DUF2784 domain-containing protein [Nocardia sp. CDC186]